jgi:transcriptional regulator with XRE-family HTH domain
MSQERLAHLADLHPTYMSRIELGKVAVTLDVASKLAHALGVPLSTMIVQAEQSADS